MHNSAPSCIGTSAGNVVRLSAFPKSSVRLKAGSLSLVTNAVSVLSVLGELRSFLRKCLPRTQVSLLLQQPLFSEMTLVLQGPAEGPSASFLLVTQHVKKHCTS